MVIIFFFFGYQKWFNCEAQALIPISHGPLIFWMYPVFGIRGATWFLGVAEWTFGLLLLLGFWNKQLGVLGALGTCFSFIATFTIVPFFPHGWEPSAGGFPAMTEHVAFLMKDLALLAASHLNTNEQQPDKTNRDPGRRFRRPLCSTELRTLWLGILDNQ
jgi:uncharacterized membrane protein YkgB